jgi:anti-sigma regulatory factor (Ser/Thr protein kinase)
VEVLRVDALTQDLLDDVTRRLRTAFAEASRAVVVSLPDGADAGAALAVQEEAATLARDWGAVPVVIACPSSTLRQQLLGDGSGRYVAVTSGVPQALTSVLGLAAAETASRALSPHPTSPRAARSFVSSTLLEWELPERVPAAELVVSELVTNAMLHARTHIDLRVAAHHGAVRISVADGTPDMTSVARAPHPLPDRRAAGGRSGRGLAVVAALSERWGVLPTSDGGKAVWALLDGAGTVGSSDGT